MHHYTATISWSRGEQPFIDNRYSRRHLIRFDGGVQIPASASPQIVRVPLSDPAAVDPEEAFVAALSSCHMLSFLSIAAREKFCVDSYVDEASGIMEKNAAGKWAVSVVTLKPRIACSGPIVPSHEQLLDLHHRAHEECFIANSVRTEVRCEPEMAS